MFVCVCVRVRVSKFAYDMCKLREVEICCDQNRGLRVTAALCSDPNRFLIHAMDVSYVCVHLYGFGVGVCISVRVCVYCVCVSCGITWLAIETC